MYLYTTVSSAKSHAVRDRLRAPGRQTYLRAEQYPHTFRGAEENSALFAVLMASSTSSHLLPTSEGRGFRIEGCEGMVGCSRRQYSWPNKLHPVKVSITSTLTFYQAYQLAFSFPKQKAGGHHYLDRSISPSRKFEREMHYLSMLSTALRSLLPSVTYILSTSISYH